MSEYIFTYFYVHVCVYKNEVNLFTGVGYYCIWNKDAKILLMNVWCSKETMSAFFLLFN